MLTRFIFGLIKSDTVYGSHANAELKHYRKKLKNTLKKYSAIKRNLAIDAGFFGILPDKAGIFYGLESWVLLDLTDKVEYIYDIDYLKKVSRFTNNLTEVMQLFQENIVGPFQALDKPDSIASVYQECIHCMANYLLNIKLPFLEADATETLKSVPKTIRAIKRSLLFHQKSDSSLEEAMDQLASVFPTPCPSPKAYRLQQQIRTLQQTIQEYHRQAESHPQAHMDWLIQHLEEAASRASLQQLHHMMQRLHKQINVVVLGSYNHGKSSLLNALIDKPVFSVADKRETTEIGQHRQGELNWIDTPGLNADVAGNDDRKAHQALLESADIVLLVHSMIQGELDKQERLIFQQWLDHHQTIGMPVALVLTKTDQVPTREQRKLILQTIRKQLSGSVPIFLVSSEWHQDPDLRSLAQITELKSWITEQMDTIDAARKKSIEHLKKTINAEIQNKIDTLKQEINDLTSQLKEINIKYENDKDHPPSNKDLAGA